MPSALDLTTALVASSFRRWRGTLALDPAPRQPARPLELYEYEASPYCRLVREVLTELDLDALIHPCPQGGTRFRQQAVRLGGKAQFPFLVDPNTGTRLHESADIIDYLRATYGERGPIRRGLRRQLGVGGSYLASTVRGFSQPRGLRARPSRAPAQPLELFSYEASPHARGVREVLSELELPYLLRNLGVSGLEPLERLGLRPAERGPGRNRRRLQALTGSTDLPCLVDPNTGVTLSGAAEIREYLDRTYARG